MARAKTTFTLEIEFAGMCLFARNPMQARMSVLLPSVHGHEARLFYRDADVLPGPRPPSPCTAPEAPPCADLTGAEIDLTRLLPGASSGAVLDSTIVDLTSVLPATHKVRRELLTGSVTDPLAARILLDDGSLGKPNPGTRWQFRRKRRWMAISGVWRVHGVSRPLKLELPGGNLTLSPRGNRLRIHIFNATPEEHPDSRLRADSARDASHFKHYYELLRDVPASEQTVPDTPELNLPKSRIEKAQGRLFTCIMAQAQAEQPLT